MQPEKKRIVVELRGLARSFGGMSRKVSDRSAEDMAVDYQNAARQGGTLLIDAFRAGLLPKTPGLARLIARDLDEARLFRQFHGYEDNAAVLLSGVSKPKPGEAAVTCGLLPQLLPEHPVFRSRSYRGRSPEREALLTDLRRAREACVWLAARIAGQGEGESAATKRRPAKKTIAKPSAKASKTRQKCKTKAT